MKQVAACLLKRRPHEKYYIPRLSLHPSVHLVRAKGRLSCLLSLRATSLVPIRCYMSPKVAGVNRYPGPRPGPTKSAGIHSWCRMLQKTLDYARGPRRRFGRKAVSMRSSVSVSERLLASPMNARRHAVPDPIAVIWPHPGASPWRRDAVDTLRHDLGRSARRNRSKSPPPCPFLSATKAARAGIFAAPAPRLRNDRGVIASVGELERP